ncbi:MAG: hypothetical protein PHH49_05935 [Candidatus Omnitrophica bacterium]|nr:hypothetical protein [Candidatus Omnitrophota bacterium]MDD5488481.1 hypothetical protein [Candidatus Omnitrophota bacterium]
MKTRRKGFIPLLAMVIVIVAVYAVYQRYAGETTALKRIISRLEADTRVAEVLVTSSELDKSTGKTRTTIKFLEYDASGEPMKPRYFTFSGNIIQFQSLVARFQDPFVRGGDRLRGKSIYLFWKIFMLDGKNTEEYELTALSGVPDGYKLPDDSAGRMEKEIWENFWKCALDPKKAARTGVKNAQIEAPGTLFVPGVVYTIKIENDGGMRIDASPIPAVLKGERIS